MKDLEHDIGLTEHGDFMVTEGSTREAAAVHSERSQAAKQVDQSRRAPVTTNYEQWAANPGRWDYPGVDTPRSNPHLLPKDVMTSARVRTRDFGGKGSKPPERPVGRHELARAIDRSEAVGRGVSAPVAGFADRRGTPEEVEKRRQRREMKDPDYHGVPEVVQQAERFGRARSGGGRDLDDISWHYEEMDNGCGMSLEEFGARVRRKKRKLGGLADDFAAAGIVASERCRD